MTLPYSQLGPVQPAATQQALRLLPFQPADVPPGGKTTGISLQRTNQIIPTPGLLLLTPQGNIDTTQSPDENADPETAIASLFTLDCVAPVSLNDVAPNAPTFVDFWFTTTPGRAKRPSSHVRLIFNLWGFWYGEGPGSESGVPYAHWQQLRSALVSEDERHRLSWREILGTESTSLPYDALAIVPMIPEGLTLPTLDYTIAMVAVTP